MIPYTDFLYFGVSLYAMIPALVAGFFKRYRKIGVVAATALMLVIQYTDVNASKNPLIPGITLIMGYAVIQWMNAALFLSLRRYGANRFKFYLAIFIGLLPLLAIKIAPIFGNEDILAFIGLSYITFRNLDVIFGIQDGLIQNLPPIQYLIFLLYFPTISSGPIDRYRRFSTDWEKERTHEEIISDIDGGIQHIFTGFLYKFILAALIKQYWLDPISKSNGFIPIASYMYAYTFYLFFDFAGYSAFAIGFSYLLGIRTPENFNRPFISRDIRDFWTRWHISLSFWFRDHVYNRFVFAALKRRWFKNHNTASYLGYIITMGLMGFWHGTTLNYIVYGFYHGVLLALTDWLNRRFKGNRLLNSNGLAWQAGSILITFHLIAFGLLVFSGRLF